MLKYSYSALRPLHRSLMPQTASSLLSPWRQVVFHPGTVSDWIRWKLKPKSLMYNRCMGANTHTACHCEQPRSNITGNRRRGGDAENVGLDTYSKPSSHPFHIQFHRGVSLIQSFGKNKTLRVICSLPCKILYQSPESLHFEWHIEWQRLLVIRRKLEWRQVTQYKHIKHGNVLTRCLSRQQNLVYQSTLSYSVT